MKNAEIIPLKISRAAFGTACNFPNGIALSAFIALF